MSNPWIVLAVTFGLIALSAFFVAVEFALIAARRHRLEDEAAASRSARAALRSSTELSVLLAGSQLGITACTLALGATTKPAVHYWLTPLIRKLGRPAVACRRGRLRARACHRHLPAPRDRRNGPEVIGARPPRADGDSARDTDANIHDVHPTRPHRAEPRRELVCAKARRRTGRRARRRAGSGCLAAPCRTLGGRRDSRPAALPQPDQSTGTRAAHRRRYRLAHCGIEHRRLPTPMRQRSRASHSGHTTSGYLSTTRTRPSSVWCMSATPCASNPGSTAARRDAARIAPAGRHAGVPGAAHHASDPKPPGAHRRRRHLWSD